VQLKQELKLVMPEEVLNKIKYLCSKIYADEWSGILFYSIEGTIKEPSKMKITLEDILPMDKGSKAYTSYDIDERYVNYLMDDEKRMDWHMGHIHSHNTMPVFFSGTDMEELNDNSQSHNVYLSLIVNNFMEFCAKAAFVAEATAEVKEIPYMAKDEEGNDYVIETSKFNIKKEKMFVYDCNVISEQEEILIDKDFAEKVEDICKPKVTHTRVKTYNGSQWKHKTNFDALGNQNNKHKGVVSKRMSDRKIDNSAYHQFMKDYQDEIVNDYPVHPNVEEDHTDIEIFAMMLLNFTNHLSSDDTIDSLISDIEELEIDENQLALTILEHLPALFEQQFPNYDENGQMFISVVEQVVELFEENVTIYPILNQTIDLLKSTVTKFEDYAARTTV